MLINLHNIQKGRSLLMGFAILWIITFHYWFLVGTPLTHFFNKGFLGVDIFMALSSFGLCFSLSKDYNYINFIKKRVLRILPTWWLLITLMLIVNLVSGNNHPQTIWQYICYYSGLGWWFYHNEPFGIYYYEWYIPTLLLFYLFMPWIYKWSNKLLLFGFVLSIIAGSLLSYFHIEERLDMSYQRIPVFIFGVLLYRAYKAVQEGRNIKLINRACILSSTIGVIGLILIFSGVITGLYGRLLYCFMFAMPLLLNLLVILFTKIKLYSALSYIGTITLELYILHIYEVPLREVLKIIKNRDVAIIVTTILLVGISFLISKGISRVMKHLKGSTNR